MQFFSSLAVRLPKCLRLRGAGLSSELQLTQLRHVSSCYQSPRRGHAEQFQLAALPPKYDWLNCCMCCVISCPFHKISYLYCDKCAEVKSQWPLVLLAIKRLLIDPDVISMLCNSVSFHRITEQSRSSVCHIQIMPQFHYFFFFFC